MGRKEQPAAGDPESRCSGLSRTQKTSDKADTGKVTRASSPPCTPVSLPLLSHVNRAQVVHRSALRPRNVFRGLLPGHGGSELSSGGSGGSGRPHGLHGAAWVFGVQGVRSVVGPGRGSLAFGGLGVGGA
ncbi:unnamed protein product [Gadus morhua 'NCC']